LEKRPSDRPQSAQEIVRVLDAIAITADRPSFQWNGVARLSHRALRVWLSGAAAVIVAASLVGWYLARRRETPTHDVLRVSLSSPGTLTPQLSATVSPNGKQVAFVATDSAGRAMLWVRALDQLDARALPGTQRAAHPFWSPDGRSVGF